ncbi:hypothetical protein PHACT_12520 [Pseudohongiella acticola]|uniref:Uncharacterized protein n=1 Tax=Pseudohongiella acticola TaxID=1524254 RepID=A0A1E8CGB9_9GAMM|nr:DUF1833 family protein [Pseudohongiella acticola]OFE11375.1 hypothetical protein PHACT_12520 [Pseudohongiella acticola]
MSNLNTVRASAPSGIVIVETLEVLHDSFPSPIRVTNQLEAFSATLEDTAPHDAGQLVAFQPAYFELILPNANNGGTEIIDVNITNIDQVAADRMEIAMANPGPVSLIFRVYLSSDTSGPAIDPPTRLTIESAAADYVSLRAKAKNADNINRKFPGWVYNTFDHPGLAR